VLTFRDDTAVLKGGSYSAAVTILIGPIALLGLPPCSESDWSRLGGAAILLGVGYERHVVCTRRTTRSDRSADNVVAAFTKAKEADILVLSSFGSTAV